MDERTDGRMGGWTGGRADGGGHARRTGADNGRTGGQADDGFPKVKLLI